jgi:hypothetical protein
MNERMTLERFQELADAYGGVVARWPETVRAAAMQMAAGPAGSAILAEALALDETLDAWAIPPASDTLRGHVLAGAPVAKQSITGRARLWWSGIGIAAALAGVAAGTAAVALLTPLDASTGSSTSFGDVGPQES